MLGLESFGQKLWAVMPRWAKPIVFDLVGIEICLVRHQDRALWDAAVTDPEGAAFVQLTQVHTRLHASLTRI